MGQKVAIAKNSQIQKMLRGTLLQSCKKQLDQELLLLNLGYFHRRKYTTRTQPLLFSKTNKQKASSQRFSITNSFSSFIMPNPYSSKAVLEGCLTLLRLRLAWIPLSLIFTVIWRSDKSGLRKGGFTLTACFFLGSTMYLINFSTVSITINNNLRTRHRDKTNLPASRVWFKNESESR